MGMRKIFASAILLAIAQPGAVMADSIDAGNDWGSNWAFPSPGRSTVGLLQSDLIEKQENDYYDGLGKVNMTVNNDITYDNRQGSFDNITASGNASVDSTTHVGDEIGQNTNVIGAINNSNTNVEIKGNNNTVSATNGATNTGCLNGGITTIDGSSDSAVGGASCP